MKRFSTLFALLTIFAVVGCNENGGDNVNPNDKTDVPENLFFGLDKESASISPDGGSVDVIVYSNYKWEISGTSDWCTPSMREGEANEDGQKVTFSAEIAYDTREAVFWFRCADKQIKFVVSQGLKEVVIADETSTFNVPSEGGIVSISYQTTVDCKVIIPDEAKDWILLAETRALVGEAAILNVLENTTYSARTAVVRVVAVHDNNLVVEYTINQAQNDVIIADDNTTFSLNGLAQSVNIAYRTNVECEVVIPEEAKEWILLTPATRALVKESATLDITENNTGAERSAAVKVVAVANSKLLAEYTITQSQRYFIEYTSTDGSVVTPHDGGAFGANIIRNKYIDGKGYIDFETPITSIERCAFAFCSSLASITIPDSVTSIGECAFWHCTSLVGIIIPNSVTSIGQQAFIICSGLNSITIPDSVTKIESLAFAFCSSLTSITIPDSVTSIEEYAFCDCSNLTSIAIPSSVTSIGMYAFEACSQLAEVYCKSTTPPNAKCNNEGVWSTFNANAYSRKIYVPQESVEAYKSAQGWSEYADNIIGYNFESDEDSDSGNTGGGNDGATKYAGWAELPTEENNSDYYYAYHMRSDKSSQRNFSVCYSAEMACPVWVACPIHSCYVGSAGRSGYSQDPEIPASIQAVPDAGTTNKGNYMNRGHMLASNMRTVSSATNKQVFYYTNIAPQNGSNFNTGGGWWNNLEAIEKSEFMCADTLYTVNGCHWANKNETFNGQVVPTHFYKVFLRTKKGNSGKWVVSCSESELQCVAFYVPHTIGKTEPSRSHMISVSELERITGHTFFSNVPNAPKDTFNASDWGM